MAREKEIEEMKKNRNEEERRQWKWYSCPKCGKAWNEEDYNDNNPPENTELYDYQFCRTCEEELKKQFEEERRQWKWYKCPQCEKVWSEEGNYYDTDPPENVKISEEKLCSSCEEIIVEGRRLSPSKEVDLRKVNFDERLKCPVCGADVNDWISYHNPLNPSKDTFKCENCNSYVRIRSDEDKKISKFQYREDLETKEFNETFNERVEIIKSEGTVIKGKGKKEGEKKEEEKK